MGARLIQLPSGCMPMISEWACWAICRISVLRYASGIQSRGSIFCSASTTSAKYAARSSSGAGPPRRPRAAAARSSASAASTSPEQAAGRLVRGAVRGGEVVAIHAASVTACASSHQGV